MRKSIPALRISGLVLLLIFSIGFAQFTFKDVHSNWKYGFKPEKGAKVGDKIRLQFDATSDDQWHIYSVQTSDVYRPTALVIEKIKGLKPIGKLTEVGKPESHFDDLMGGTMFYFHHKASFWQDFMVTDEQILLQGFFEFQICDTMNCMFPRIELDIKTTALPGKVDPSLLTPDPVNPVTDTVSVKPDCTQINTPSPDFGGGDDLRPTRVVEKIKSLDVSLEGGEDAGLWSTFWEAFIYGFVAILTPCVFPMIPMTVSFFTKQSKNRSEGIRKGVLFSASIIMIYTVLGLLVTAVFGSDTLNNISTNPWVNLGFFLILFVFALSFLGWFEITLPSGLVNKISEESDKRTGLLGIFFMALTLAVVSFSCTGPLIGSVLVNVDKGAFLSPVIAMFGFSFAFSIPFGLFAVFPGWLNSLPRSGGWLNSVKVVLGFVELALGMKFLSNADLMWRTHWLDREVFLAIWIVIAIMTGIYLLGKISLPHDSPTQHISVLRLMFAMCAFSFGVYLIPGMFGAPLSPLSGLLPPHHPEVGVIALNGGGSGTGLSHGGNSFNAKICEVPNRKFANTFKDFEGHGFCTFFDLEQAMAFAQFHKKPILLDFTGINCANCRKMENGVWPKPEVSTIMKDEYVMVELFVDDKTALKENYAEKDGAKIRSFGDAWLWVQKTAFNQSAQPYYVALSPDGKVLTPPCGYTPEVDSFKVFLQKGIEAFKKLPQP